MEESKIIKAARKAVEFAGILSKIPMEDKNGYSTVVVSKNGKVLGVVHGQRPAKP